jgi:hypothetical protein
VAELVSTDVRIDGGREIGWTVDNPAFRVHNARVLLPERGGTRVVTEEAQKGADVIKFRLEQPNAMYEAMTGGCRRSRNA